MSSRAPLFTIDANVLLRHLLDDHDELSAQAAEILEGVEDGRTAVYCDPVTLAEVVWVLGSYYRQSNEVIVGALGPMVKAPGFHMPQKGMYVDALRLFGQTVRHFRDACACAAALHQSEGRLYSFDRKLSAVPGVERFERLPDAGA